ncbi:outer membrane lipoprotein carrier protein LolA [uncultured Sphingomonas sp.]|uniref:LolA family protein n=1 Tax=uncultured Sphingomonas sp. TaxID=158754 RepID=UPI0025FD08F1|nr:outer membrane lipoprotein carrier protein LolA [uncultured Sphingomonas sp.]
MFKPVYLTAAVVAIAAPAVAQTAPEIAQVQRHLQAVSTMTANFTQTDRAGKVLTGTLTLKKPGKVRFQYEKSVPILIVGDGKDLWFLDYSVGQKSRWPVGNSPLGVLLDPTKDISKFASLQPSANPNVVSIEARDPKRPEFGRITLVFAKQASAPGGLMLQGWVALDSQGNRTSIRLSNQQFGVPVSDQAFKWRDPKRGSVRN